MFSALQEPDGARPQIHANMPEQEALDLLTIGLADRRLGNAVRTGRIV